MTYHTTASLHKLTCTDYVDFGKCQHRLCQFSWSESESNYLDVKRKVFKKDDKRGLCEVQNLTMGEADFNQFMHLRNQLVIAAKDFV